MNSRMEDFERRYRELLDRARKKEVTDISNQDLNNIIKTGLRYRAGIFFEKAAEILFREEKLLR